MPIQIYVLVSTLPVSHPTSLLSSSPLSLSECPLAGAKRAVTHALESSYEEALEFESYLQEAEAGSQEFSDGVQAFLARRARK